MSSSPAVCDGEVRVGVTARAFNATIRSRRLEMGLTQAQVARLAGVKVHRVNHLETLRRPAVDEKSRRILAVLGLDESASPPWLAALELYGARTVERSVTAELVGLAPLRELGSASTGWDDDLSDLVDHSVARDWLKALPERERRILELRFGFYGEPLTLDAVGHEMDLTRERVRQIQDQALERLRTISAGRDRWFPPSPGQRPKRPSLPPAVSSKHITVQWMCDGCAQLVRMKGHPSSVMTDLPAGWLTVGEGDYCSTGCIPVVDA